MLIVMFAMVAPIPVTRAGSAFGEVISVVIRSVYRYTAAPQQPANDASPKRTLITRLTVSIGETRDVPLAAHLNSVLVVSPEIASAVLNSRGVTLAGLKVGETMLIGFDGPSRLTFLVEVVGRTYARTPPDTLAANAAASDLNAMAGTYSVSYSAPFGGAPALLRQSFAYTKKLPGSRTLRFSSEMFKSVGQGNQLSLSGFGVGVNRMSLGIDGPEGSLDILDSQINVSPLSFNGYTMRGLHIVSATTSRLRGVEFFAGQARPSLSLFDMNQDRVLGVVVPVAHGDTWRVRAGVFSVSPSRDNRLGNGGTAWHLDGRYAPNTKLALEAEMAYANGGLSWRARLDLQKETWSASGEIVRFDRRSPLVSIGAQSGGREAESLGIQWRVTDRLNTSFSYNHTATVPTANALSATLDRTTFSANANYRLNDKSNLGVRFVQQQIGTGTLTGGKPFRLETRTISISQDQRLNKSWTNNFTARLTSSQEPLADTGTERGIVLNEQLRYSFNRGSVAGFVNYTRQEQSLAGLIVRNPRLLPPQLQDVFAADPARFLEQNRDSLGMLIPGVELPQTRGLDVGMRLQAAFSRVSLAAETRYSASQIVARSQRSLLTSLSMDLRLDAANSVQLTGSRSIGFDGPGQSQLTVSYVHRFGAGSGGGMQFSRLLGLERGKIQGRVFFDLNGDGRDDPNEPGVAGLKVQIGGDSPATTDGSGHFSFGINSGSYRVSLISEELGVLWRASTTTEQKGFLSARQTINVSFGVNNYGAVAGRVFNDVLHQGEPSAGDLPGVAEVRLNLRSLKANGPSSTTIVDSNGGYQFRNVPPGNYALEIDSGTLPADFRVPSQTSWIVLVGPLQVVYRDIPLSAQRAVSGVVYIDQDGNGKYESEKDQTVEGALVFVGNTQTTTGRDGAYIFRNLHAGKIQVRARSRSGVESTTLTIELATGPTRKKGVNLIIQR